MLGSNIAVRLSLAHRVEDIEEQHHCSDEPSTQAGHRQQELYGLANPANPSDDPGTSALLS